MNEMTSVVVKIGIENGPNISLSRAIEVDAYEKINVNIKNEDKDKMSNFGQVIKKGKSPSSNCFELVWGYNNL